uniref:Uncharacterized protein n=1 Tax=Meloidogyne incognita TaxID=6306 RepID=A0A914KM21_MELIC
MERQSKKMPKIKRIHPLSLPLLEVLYPDNIPLPNSYNSHVESIGLHRHIIGHCHSMGQNLCQSVHHSSFHYIRLTPGIAPHSNIGHHCEFFAMICEFFNSSICEFFNREFFNSCKDLRILQFLRILQIPCNPCR